MPSLALFKNRLLYFNDGVIPHIGSLKAHEVDHGSGHARKAKAAVVGLDRVGVFCVGVVVDDAGHAVEGVAGLGLVGAVLAGLGLTLLVGLVHLVGIAVVGSEERHATEAVNDGQEACQLKVKRLHRATGRRKRAGMTYHIAGREVDAQIFVFAAFQAGYNVAKNANSIAISAIPNTSASTNFDGNSDR